MDAQSAPDCVSPVSDVPNLDLPESRGRRKRVGIRSTTDHSSALESSQSAMVSMKDVNAWLEELGLSAYADAFVENGIDAALLPELKNDDLKDMGVARVADRRRLLKAIEQLTPASRTGGTETSPMVAPRGEHRQATVLFADIAGSTRLTSELGAEETHSLLNRFFEAVNAILLSYGSSANRYIGDSFMAVFGAPIAHDDDPFRAVRASFDIHKRVRCLLDERGRPLQVHIGIANGRVVAGGMGTDTHCEYTVIGDSVNLAARLQDQAAPGETLISDALHAIIADRVSCKDRGRIYVRGIKRLVRVWEVKELRALDEPLPRVAFVGREAEQAQLTGAVDICLASGSGRAIVVRGKAGIGKTRLVQEFTRLASANSFKVHRGLVLDFGVGEGRDAVRAVVQSLVGIPAGSDRATRRSAADMTVANQLLAPEQRMFLNDLLDLPQPPEDLAIYDAMTNTVRIEGKRTAIADLLRASSVEQPLAIVIEDIHWADPLSLAYLATMAATFADCRGLLVMTSRLEGYPLNKAWHSMTGDCPVINLDLGPLRQEESIKLAAAFLDTSQQISLQCVLRAEGNPLFLEQLLRHVEEHGEGQVPASIQSLVMARIDRLHPADKQAVQAASVLGQRFALEALRHLIAVPSYDCRELIQRSLVRPEGDDFLFDHALVREGIYESLLQKRRCELHREAAAFFAEKAPLLRAEHLDCAGDSAAADAYLKAARVQAALLHFDEALQSAERGIELADAPALTCDLSSLRGDILRSTGATDSSIAAFEVALALAGDNKRRCMALIGMADALRIADRHKKALDVLADAESAAIQQGLVHEQARIHYLRANVYFLVGNIDGCLAEHEKALAFAREINSTEGEAIALGGLGDAHYLRGHMRTACEQFRACVKVCREQGYRHIEVPNRIIIAYSRIHFMEFTEALEDALDLAKLAAKMRNQRAELLGQLLAAAVYTEFGKFAEADASARRSLVLARLTGAHNYAAQSLSILAQTRAAQDRRGEALEHAEHAVAIVREVGMTFIGPAVLVIKAALAEDPQDAFAILQEAESILDSGCVAHNHVWFARTAIDLAVAVGAWPEVERYADRLEDFTRGHPLAWSDFMIARARALAAWGRGTRSRELITELERLRECAVQHGLALAMPQLDEALAAA